MYEEKKQPRVLVFTTPTCGYCTKAKSYLKRNGIKFREIDISRDPDGARDVKRMTGGTSVPVIMVGPRVVKGFDKAKLDSYLDIRKSRPDEDTGEDS
ncbi:MAG: glutaredoxin family protein [Nitrospirae bacterium]|nr:glutaredoxin family protein [Nitrospirota bacterium]